MTAAFLISAAALAAGLAGTDLAQPAAADPYADTLRSILQRIEHYPNSREARQLRPQGTARIWLELDGGGRLVDAGIERSSGSALLDSQALQAARRGAYPGFAASATGAHRRFVVPVEFRPDAAH